MFWQMQKKLHKLFSLTLLFPTIAAGWKQTTIVGMMVQRPQGISPPTTALLNYGRQWSEASLLLIDVFKV